MRIGIDVRILREERRGVGHYVANLLENLMELAKDDTFFLYSPSSIKFKPITEDNWHCRFGKFNLPGFFWFQFWGKALITMDKLDIFFQPYNILPQNLPARIKKIVAVHDFLASKPNMLAHYGRLLHKLFFEKTLRLADHIIVFSEAVKQKLVQYFPVNPEKITVIYYGVKKMFHPYDKAEIARFRQQYKLFKPYILTVATLEPVKNYPTLLKAFKRISRDYDLVIIGGKGWKAQTILSLIDELKLTERVKLMGYVSQEQLPPFYNGAEIYVHPSLYEGFGQPVLEAMACGVPIIASNSSSLPEIGGNAALYFNPKSVDELVFKIETLLTDNELRKNLIKKGLARAKNFTWEKTAQETLTVLKTK